MNMESPMGSIGNNYSNEMRARYGILPPEQETVTETTIESPAAEVVVEEKPVVEESKPAEEKPDVNND